MVFPPFERFSFRGIAEPLHLFVFSQLRTESRDRALAELLEMATNK